MIAKRSYDVEIQTSFTRDISQLYVKLKPLVPPEQYNTTLKNLK